MSRSARFIAGRHGPRQPRIPAYSFGWQEACATSTRSIRNGGETRRISPAPITTRSGPQSPAFRYASTSRAWRSVLTVWRSCAG